MTEPDLDHGDVLSMPFDDRLLQLDPSRGCTWVLMRDLVEETVPLDLLYCTYSAVIDRCLPRQEEVVQLVEADE